MRDPLWWYLGLLGTLALTTVPVPAGTAAEQMLPPLQPWAGPGLLPGPLLCGTTAAVAEGAANIQGESRPRLPASYQTEHFTFSYTNDPHSPHAPALDDQNKNGVPDYVEHLGLYFEQAWSRYTGAAPTGMACTPPPLKSGARYPVYVYQLPANYSGQTWPEDRSGRRASSHVSIDSHLYEPYVRHIAAHEFFHAVQFSYNVSASSWWKEASADWASSQVFPDVDAYLIPYYDWFQVPGWSLDTTDGWHEYGSSLWAEYLSEALGRDVIRAIWESQRSENDPLQAMEHALAGLGTDLADQFRDFAVWNWFTGDRADTTHYQRGHLYPMLGPAERPAGAPGALSGTLAHLGSAYFPWVASGRGAARGLTVRLKAEDGVATQLILERKDGTRITMAVSGARFHVAGFEAEVRRAVLVLSNDDRRSHTYSTATDLGFVYRDQYGYVWDLGVDPAGAVRGTVEVGDAQPWPVTGAISDSSFHWRAVNPGADKSNRWTPGFDVSGSSLNRTDSAPDRWTNDTGRADTWIGAALNGPVPAGTLTNRRGPALR